MQTLPNASVIIHARVQVRRRAATPGRCICIATGSRVTLAACAALRARARRRCAHSAWWWLNAPAGILSGVRRRAASVDAPAVLDRVDLQLDSRWRSGEIAVDKNSAGRNHVLGWPERHYLHALIGASAEFYLYFSRGHLPDGAVLNSELLWVLSLLLIAIVLFTTNKLRMDVVALLVIIALLSGTLSLSDAVGSAFNA